MPVLRVLQELWDRIAGTQPVPPSWVVAASAVVALIAVLGARPWHLARNAITIAHEGGHALVSVLTGRRLDGIRLHSDTSGVTYSKGRPTGPGIVLTSAAGYVTPPLLGAGAAWLLAAHHVTATLWLLLVLLAATFLAIRNAYGALAVLVTAGAVLAASWLASAAVQAAFGYAAAWFLLLGGVRPVIELMTQRHRDSRGRAGISDADRLARLTGVPGGVWAALFLLVSVAALILGARLLVAGAVHLPHLTALTRRG
jgi:Peptidase M50B-like